MLNQSLGASLDARVDLADLIRYGMDAEIYKGHEAGDLLVIKDCGEEWPFVISTLILNENEKFHIISDFSNATHNPVVNI